MLTTHRTLLKFSKRFVLPALLLALVPLGVFAAPGWAADPVSYREASWDSTAKTVKYTEKTTDNYTVVKDQRTWSDGWYVVKEDVTIASLIEVNGTVNLILCDNAKLNANAGIMVASNNTPTSTPRPRARANWWPTAANIARASAATITQAAR